MSLINKMLQDLETRRSEVSGSGTYGNQVRVVPERAGIHPAWWVALGLGAALAGVLAWTMLRPAPAVLAEARPQLPLKLDTGLSSGQIVTEQRFQEQDHAAAPADTPVVAEPVGTMPPSDHRPNEQAQEIAAAAPPAEIEKPRLEAAAPEKTQAAAPSIAKVKDLPTVPAATEARLPVINKQVKEFTPQQRADNEYRKALVWVQQGKAGQAVSSLEHALGFDPRHAAARQTLVGMLLEDKRQDDALRIAREGMALDPAQPGLAMITARLQLEKGELRPAIETLQRTLPHAEDRADYQAFLAALLQRDARHKEAVEHYLLALQRAPQNGIWWMGLGISLQADNRTAEAREAFNRAKTSNALTPDLLAFVESKLRQMQR